jgi:hypothetical protein
MTLCNSNEARRRNSLFEIQYSSDKALLVEEDNHMAPIAILVKKDPVSPGQLLLMISTRVEYCYTQRTRVPWGGGQSVGGRTHPFCRGPKKLQEVLTGWVRQNAKCSRLGVKKNG